MARSSLPARASSPLWTAQSRAARAPWRVSSSGYTPDPRRARRKSPSRFSRTAGKSSVSRSLAAGSTRCPSLSPWMFARASARWCGTKSASAPTSASPPIRTSCPPHRTLSLPYAIPPRNRDAAVGATAPASLGISSGGGSFPPSPGARNMLASTPCWRVYRSW